MDDSDFSGAITYWPEYLQILWREQHPSVQGQLLVIRAGGPTRWERVALEKW